MNTSAILNSTRKPVSVKTGLQLSLWSAKSGYGLLGTALDELEALPSVRRFLAQIKQSRRNTRPGYPPRAMFRAVCLKYLISERFTVGFIEHLRSSPKLAELCGFSGAIPSEATFSRFIKKLFKLNTDLSIAEMVDRLQAKLPGLGEDVAVDSTDIKAHANPNRTIVRDPDATWGYRTTKSNSSSKKKSEPFFGYKMHALNDAKYGVPLVHIVLPANKTDMRLLPDLVRKAQQTHPWLKPKHLIADRGYDSQANHQYLIKHGIIPIIHVRDPVAKDGLYSGMYNKKGFPVCDDGKTPMEFLGTDPTTGHHLFRCPPAGCALKGKSTGAMLHCNVSVMAEDPMNDPRALGIVARASPQWDQLYARRQVIERMFGSMKRMRLLDKHQYLERRKIENHIGLSVLTYLATMMARVKAGDIKRLRHMRIR